MYLKYIHLSTAKKMNGGKYVEYMKNVLCIVSLKK